VTEHLNRHWYEKNAGQVVTDVQRQLFHAVHRWMAGTHPVAAPGQLAWGG